MKQRVKSKNDKRVKGEERWICERFEGRRRRRKTREDKDEICGNVWEIKGNVECALGVGGLSGREKCVLPLTC